MSDAGQHVGLTVGKFAPLHKGHQFLIESALLQVDHLIVMIYACPDVIDIPLHQRAGWLRTLYPHVEVMEAPDGPQDMGDTPRIRALQENYILGRLQGRRVTHFFSSEFYGDHMSRALNARDCRVDEPRQAYPISATRIRRAPYANRQWLHPLVYADMDRMQRQQAPVRKVVFLGAPSTGKSTIAKAMARQLNTHWMPEYGREYWETHQVDRRLTPAQLVEIAREHLHREDQLLAGSKGYLFVDTNALTTRQFALEYHGWAHPELEKLANAAASRYDSVFLCDDDIAYDDTWDRSGEVSRRRFQQAIRADLEERGINAVVLRGDLQTRMQTIQDHLECLAQ